MKIGRNDPCPCGSGKKYKRCCLGKENVKSMSDVARKYTESIHPLFGDVMWHFNCAGIEVLNLIPEFLKKYQHDGYSLSIFDTITNWSGVEVLNVPFEEIDKIIDFIYHTEHAEPIDWIGVNSLSESYVVAMPLTCGHINGYYCVEDGKLKVIPEVKKCEDEEHQHGIQMKSSIMEYREKYGDDWILRWLDDNSTPDDVDGDMKFINTAIYHGETATISCSTMKQFEEFNKKQEDRQRELYGDRYDELVQHKYGDSRVVELLLQDAIRTGKWKELPDELWDEYKKRVGMSE